MKKAPKPTSTPAGARPATVMAPITCGMKVPRSPQAPASSEGSWRHQGRATGAGIVLFVPGSIDGQSIERRRIKEASVDRATAV